MILQIFPPSFFGTNIVENSELLPVAIFSSEWYQIEEPEKRSLLIFLTRSLRPFDLRAGKLFMLNINTFIKVFYSIGFFREIIGHFFFNFSSCNCLKTTQSHLLTVEITFIFRS